MFRGLFGLGVYAEEFFPASDIAFLYNIWGSIRAAAKYTDINWAAINYPGGPQISAVSDAILGASGVWPNIRRAASFTDIDWHKVNLDPSLVAAAKMALAPPVAQPVPELPPANQPTMQIPVTPTGPDASVVPAVAQPVPEVTSPGTTAPAPYVPFDWGALFGSSGVGTEPNLNLSPGQPTLTPSDTGDGTTLPVITPTGAAPVQAGMFGDMKTWLLVSAVGLGLYFMSGAHKKGGRRGRGRRARA